MTDSKSMLIILTEGKADNGRKATVGFAMGLSACAMNVDATVFLTSDAAVWGYEHSAYGITVPGFSPLADLIDQFTETGGKLLLCSTCHLTCGAGDPRRGPEVKKMDCVVIAGMASVIEMSLDSTTITF